MSDDPTLPRGWRNGNPGNIRLNKNTTWLGQVPPNVQTDPEFVQFKDAMYGLRAIGMTLLTYNRAYGLRTVRGLINRWAPPVENDTSSYVTNVAQSVGMDPDAVLDLTNEIVMSGLIKGIVRQENGEAVGYPDAVVTYAIALLNCTDPDSPAAKAAPSA